MSTLFVTVSIVSLALGLINMMTQTGKFLGQWTVPAKILPYLVVFGGFLGGAYASLKSASAFDATAIFLAVRDGLEQMILGAAPSVGAHLFGLQVNVRRPPPMGDGHAEGGGTIAVVSDDKQEADDKQGDAP